VLAVLRPPLLVLGFVFGNLYKLCFGWLERRVAKQNEERFAEDIRTHLSFLFTEQAATIIPNEGTLFFPPSFDGAYVTVAVSALRLLFVRGRGDFGVSVASEFAPRHWEDFYLVADRISEWDTSYHRPSYSLETFGSILGPRLGRLQEALSKDHFEVTLNEAVRIHNENVDKYAASLREQGITPKFY
jgi:hypothetical protein